MSPSIAQQQAWSRANFIEKDLPPWAGLLDAEVKLGYALGWVNDAVVEDYIRSAKDAVRAHINADVAAAPKVEEETAA
jgi:hypothetical protein